MARKRKKPSPTLSFRQKLGLLVFIVLSLLAEYCLNPKRARTFSEAKIQARAIFVEHPVTFYCQCAFDKQGRVNWRQCGYQALKPNDERSRYIEFEHIMPAHFFGHQRPCWRQKQCHNDTQKKYGGRKCCQKIDKRFQWMEADLHNLVPAIGEINRIRSNYQFAELPHIKLSLFGRCGLRIDHQHRRFEPPERVRGLIARTYLYMCETYQLALEPAQKTLFERWDKTYPPDGFEFDWNRKVTRLQGNSNPFITAHQKTEPPAYAFKLWLKDFWQSLQEASALRS